LEWIKNISGRHDWNPRVKSDRVSLRKKIPRVRLHRVTSILEILVDEPHKFAILSVIFEFPWSGFVVEHDVLVCVIFSRFWNSENSAAIFKIRITNNVLVFEVVDTVEHHLVEKNWLIGKTKSASDGQRSRKDEVFVKKD